MTAQIAGDTVTRPGGRVYRSRKVITCAVTDDEESLCGVMVLGTHDTGRAQPLADDYAAWQVGNGTVAADPVAGWYRDGYSGGRRCWVDDPEHGRAGVWFRSITESTYEREDPI